MKVTKLQPIINEREKRKELVDFCKSAGLRFFIGNGYISFFQNIPDWENQWPLGYIGYDAEYGYTIDVDNFNVDFKLFYQSLTFEEFTEDFENFVQELMNRNIDILFDKGMHIAKPR